MDSIRSINFSLIVLYFNNGFVLFKLIHFNYEHDDYINRKSKNLNNILLLQVFIT